MNFIDIHPIILASRSPRRSEILRNHGIDPIIRPADVDESLPAGTAPEEAVQHLSRIKALACAALPEYAASHEGLILAADTIVYKDRIMGKPADAKEAFAMLSAIRGTSHSVLTGVTLIDLESRLQHSFCDITAVWCTPYTNEQIREYIAEAKPYDKAGSYAIQGSFARYIDHIDGDYENVVGLPFYRLEPEYREMMRQLR